MGNIRNQASATQWGWVSNTSSPYWDWYMWFTLCLCFSEQCFSVMLSLGIHIEMLKYDLHWYLLWAYAWLDPVELLQTTMDIANVQQVWQVQRLYHWQMDFGHNCCFDYPHHSSLPPSPHQTLSLIHMPSPWINSNLCQLTHQCQPHQKPLPLLTCHCIKFEPPFLILFFSTAFLSSPKHPLVGPHPQALLALAGHEVAAQ